LSIAGIADDESPLGRARHHDRVAQLRGHGICGREGRQQCDDGCETHLISENPQVGRMNDARRAAFRRFSWRIAVARPSFLT
jgi:hypothetical protein